MEAGFAPGVLYYLTLWFPERFRGRDVDAVPRVGDVGAGGSADLGPDPRPHERRGGPARLALAVPDRRPALPAAGLARAAALPRSHRGRRLAERGRTRAARVAGQGAGHAR